ncbi:MAG: RNA polymerase sigma factor [Candidatus Methylomirabilales bacterium]
MATILSIGASKGMAADRSSLSDQDLIEQIKAGEEAAFEAPLERYQGRVYRLVLSLTKNPEDAEEVLQDVRIAVNAALMKLRGRGPVQESLEEYLTQFTADGRQARMVVDWTQGPEAQLLRKERAQVVREAIEALPPDYQVVLVLRDLEGFSNKATSAWVKEVAYEEMPEELKGRLASFLKAKIRQEKVGGDQR